MAWRGCGRRLRSFGFSRPVRKKITGWRRACVPFRWTRGPGLRSRAAGFAKVRKHRVSGRMGCRGETGVFPRPPTRDAGCRMARGRPRIACRRIRRIGGSRPRIARSRTCRSVRGSRGTGVFRIRRIVRRRRHRTCRGSPRIRRSSGFRCRWSSFVTLLCRRCFLDRTGRVGAGDTSDMQGRSVGSFPVRHPPRGARGGDAAAHGRSAFGVRDGRRLAWRRGGRDDGARPVGVDGGTGVMARAASCLPRLRGRHGSSFPSKGATVDRIRRWRIPFPAPRGVGRGRRGGWR